jgi:cytochrome c55X
MLRSMIAPRISCPAVVVPPMRRFVIASIALAVASPLVAAAGADDPAQPAGPRQHELLRLLHQDCGSCHGLRLTGGLGPALTPSALKDKPDASLVATIVSGRRGTPMPPWQPFMSEAEARWLVARLKEGNTDGK